MAKQTKMTKKAEPAKQARVNAGSPGSNRPIAAKPPEESLPVGLVPPDFEDDYVAGAVAPFMLSSEFTGETPLLLPMIDLALTKEMAVPVQLWGMLYDDWAPNPDEEGRSVFMQGYENRGPNNERKKIYMSATTPDLIDTKYREKIERFYDRFLADTQAGKPMMQNYFDQYFDLYWDLHVAATGGDIPAEVRQFSSGFTTVLGYWFPTSEIVRQAYMQARSSRDALKTWLDTRVQEIIDGTTPNADSTFVYYWLKNGGLGENFRRIDIVFECFHNFLAFSQWGNMVYNVAAKLETSHGDPNVRMWFEKTMSEGPDKSDGSPFTPLDRLVMELFRVISPNAGSLSMLHRRHALLGEGFSGIVTPHLEANMDRRHWLSPTEFDPSRYKNAPTTVDNDEAKCGEIGLAGCPFDEEAFPVKDGRKVEMTNSVFGTVYSEINGTPYPLCDTAGYAPFGFGYRRCAGEQLTVEFVKEFLRKIWRDKISFVKLDIETPAKVPVNPGTLLNDDIAFTRPK